MKTHTTQGTTPGRVGEPEQTDLVIGKAEIGALMVYMSNDPTRRSIFGLGVFPRLGCVVVTDGHSLAKLACVEDATADGADFIIPRDALDAARKVANSKSAILLTNGEIRVYPDGDASGDVIAPIPFTSPEGKTFPPFADVIPAKLRADTTPAAAFALPPSRLAGLAKVGRACSGENAIVYPGATGMSLVLVEIGAWQVVMMPVEPDPPEGSPE